MHTGGEVEGVEVKKGETGEVREKGKPLRIDVGKKKSSQSADESKG